MCPASGNVTWLATVTVQSREHGQVFTFEQNFKSRSEAHQSLERLQKLIEDHGWEIIWYAVEAHPVN